MDEERGLRSIGSLMPTIEQLRDQKASLTNKFPTGSPPALSTTGLQGRGVVDSNSIGRRRGEITSAPILPAVNLANLHPVVVDKRLREQLPPHVASLINTAEILNSDYEVVGYKPLDISPSEALNALELIDEFFLPARHEIVLIGLARARAMTKRRTEQADDEEITLDAYAGVFTGWPADVTAIVLSRLHKLEEGWWPSGAAVERELASFGRGRMELRKALTRIGG